jgi:hypothetical protein
MTYHIVILGEIAANAGFVKSGTNARFNIISLTSLMIINSKSSLRFRKHLKAVHSLPS